MSNEAHTGESILERLARLEAKLDILISSVAARNADYENRIRNLERRQWFVAGAAAVLTSIVTSMSYIKAFIIGSVK
jgi:hypothetical protein